MPDASDVWNVLLVEDDEPTRRQVHEYLSGESFAGRQIKLQDIRDIAAAMDVVRNHKADLLILDVYRGEATTGGERVGVEVLGRIQRSGFVATILYTALPEGLEEHANEFVRLVGKHSGGLEGLKAQIDELFTLQIPQLHRAIVNHVDRTLGSYMWNFVLTNWTDFAGFAHRPEFLRLVVQRLAVTLTREGIDAMTAEIYGPDESSRNDDNSTMVHPAECYMKPPVGEDPLLGDIRVRNVDEESEHLIVLWPSCDMVAIGGRTPKTQAVLCARAMPLSQAPEVEDWQRSQSKKKERAVRGILANRREALPDKGIGSSERYHYVPGAWDIPDLIIDFQLLEHLPLKTVKELLCLGTLASPFAEAIASRFVRYLGRLGTPDLNVDVIVEALKPQQRQ